MSANDQDSISVHIIIFKNILDGFVESIGDEVKDEIYLNHCETIEKRNKEKSRMVKTKSGSKREYNDKPMRKNDYIVFHVLSLLMKTKYASLLDECTLGEIGHVLGVTRERVRQIELQGIMKIKNPNLLKKLNERNSIETIIEYKEIAVARKNRKNKAKK